MPETITVAQAHEALVDDHRRLHGLVARLGEAGDAAALATVLGELHEALTAHFNLEEKPGGLYDALGVCLAEYRVVLGQLVDDHFRIAGHVRDLRDRAAAAHGREPEGLFAEAKRLAELLAEHEKREHQLVDTATARGA